MSASLDASVTVLLTSDTSQVEQQTEAPAARPDLHWVSRNSDIAYAVHLARTGQSEYVTDSLIATFCTEFSRDQLLSLVHSMFGLLRYVGIFLRERFILARLSGQSLQEVVDEITGFLDRFLGQTANNV